MQLKVKVNPFKGHRIEFHILQSFPVSCLNRDDDGSPKSAIVGGVQRSRVSSQCWKRQVRLALHGFGIRIAVRTKHIAEKEARICIELGASEDAAKACGEAIGKALSKDTLIYFSETEALAFAQYAKELGFDASKINPKAVWEVSRKVLNPAIDGLDIALFGRMVAQATDVDLKVEAAASFAHAISTHASSPEFEFFTAIDDEETGTNSGHMGNLEFSSATYYRYISLDLGQLYENLGGNAVEEAVEAFAKALFIAVPAARQTTMSAACGWDYAKVLVRKGQRVQLSFEKPVKPKEGYLQPSIEALESGLAGRKSTFGSLFGEIDCFTVSDTSGMSIDGLVDALKKTVRAIGKQNGAENV